MWPYIIDGIFIGIIVILAVIGIAKGFFNSLLGLISTGVALVISVLCAKYLSNFVNKIFGLEEFVLNKLDGTNEGFVDFFNGKFQLSNVEVAKFCVWVLTIVLIFLIIKLVIFILAKIFEGVTKKSPTIGGLNRVLGMIFGMVKGAVTVVFLLVVCSLLGNVPGVGTTVSDKIGESTITNWAYKYVDDFTEKNLTKEGIQEIVDRIVSDNKDNNQDKNEDTNNTTTNDNQSSITTSNDI